MAIFYVKRKPMKYIFLLIAFSTLCMETPERYRNKPTFTHFYIHPLTIGKRRELGSFTITHNPDRTVTIEHKNDPIETITIEDNVERITRRYKSHHPDSSEDILALDIKF